MSVESVIVHRASDIDALRKNLDWDAFFDGESDVLRASVLQDESAGGAGNERAAPTALTHEVYVCCDAQQSDDSFANIVALVWFHCDDASGVLMLHYFAVRRDWRRKGVARKHVHSIIHDRIMSHLHGAELPLFACVPLFLRPALKFLDRLLVPLGISQQPLRGGECVFMGPPLGWSGTLPPDPPVPRDTDFESLHCAADFVRHTAAIRKRAENLIIDVKQRIDLATTSASVLRAFYSRRLPLLAVCGTALAVARYGQLVMPWDDDVDFAIHRATYIYLREHAPLALRNHWWMAHDFAVKDHFRYPEARWLTVQASSKGAHSSRNPHIDLFCMYYDCEKHAFLVQSWEANPRKHHVHHCTYREIVQHSFVALQGQRKTEIMVPGNVCGTLERAFPGWRDKILVEHPHTGRVAMRLPAQRDAAADVFHCRPLERRFAHLALDEAFYDMAEQRQHGISFCMAILTLNDLAYVPGAVESLQRSLGALNDAGRVAERFCITLVFDSTQVTLDQVQAALQNSRCNARVDTGKCDDANSSCGAEAVCDDDVLRVRLHAYDARVAQSGLETYVTPCNSAHSRAWFFQYCVQQTGPVLSHWCKWPCNARMTPALAQRLVRYFCGAKSAAAVQCKINDVLQFKVKDLESGKCAPQHMVFSIESKVRFYRLFLWESWSTALHRKGDSGAWNAKEGDTDDYVLLESALHREWPQIVGERCWFDVPECFAGEDEQEALAVKTAREQYVQWAAQLHDKQLFCRPNDPECDALMRTLPHNSEKICLFSS